MNFQAGGGAHEQWPDPLTAEGEALRRRGGRLLESLRQMPAMTSNVKAWENEHENVFSLFRHGCLDSIKTNILEAPIYRNSQMEDAWLFLIEVCRRHPNRRKHVEECAAILGASYNWSMPLYGSRKIRSVLAALPSTMCREILEAASAVSAMEELQRLQLNPTQPADSDNKLHDRPSADLEDKLHDRLLVTGGSLPSHEPNIPVKAQERKSKDDGRGTCLNPFEPANAMTNPREKSSSRRSTSLARSQDQSPPHRRQCNGTSAETGRQSISYTPAIFHEAPQKPFMDAWNATSTGSGSRNSLPKRAGPFCGPPPPNPHNPFRSSQLKADTTHGNSRRGSHTIPKPVTGVHMPGALNSARPPVAETLAYSREEVPAMWWSSLASIEGVGDRCATPASRITPPNLATVKVVAGGGTDGDWVTNSRSFPDAWSAHQHVNHVMTAQLH